MPSTPLRRVRLHSTMAAAQAAATPPSDSIVSLEAWNLTEPGTGRAWALVRVATREGAEGWGECAPLTRADLARLRAAAMQAPASAYGALRLMLGGQAGAGAVDIAALDILGKTAKAPLYQLLGGPTRKSVRAFTVLRGQDDEALAQDLERCRKAGFKAFAAPMPEPPFRNSGQAFVNAALKRVDRLLQQASAEEDLIAQGLGRLTPGDAASLADAFESRKLLWFDEPCGTASMGALRKISDESVTPLGFGQDIGDPAHFQNLLREDAVDVVRPELGIHGVTGVRKIAALAETYYVAVAPRHSEGPVNTAAALHLAASIPNFFIQHIPCPAQPEAQQMRAALAGASVEQARDGFAALPTGPGLGITVNREAVARYGEAIV